MDAPHGTGFFQKRRPRMPDCGPKTIYGHYAPEAGYQWTTQKKPKRLRFFWARLILKEMWGRLVVLHARLQAGPAGPPHKQGE
jgi:hypothetical protein